MDKSNKPIKKKVLFLLEAFDKGGIEKVTLDIVNNLNPDKYDITVQNFWYGGHCQSLVNENVKVIPFFFKRYVRGIIRLIEYLPPKLLYMLFVRGKYDVEIAASDGGAAKVISGSTNKKSKKICWVHMDVVQQGSKLKCFSNKKAANKIYSKFQKIICVSNGSKEQFIAKFQMNEKISVVHNPIPHESILNLAEEKCEVVFNHDAFNIISVGRLCEEKGFERLIKACAKLKKSDGFSIELYLIGAGPLESRILKFLEDEDISNVHLLGFRSNPYCVIKQADLYVCSSLNESYPLVVGESLVLKKPILATRCSGTCEWLETDDCGYIVENDDDALYEGIKRVLTDKEFFEKLQNKSEKKSQAINFNDELLYWEKQFLA